MKKILTAGLIGAMCVCGLGVASVQAADKPQQTVTVLNLGAIDEAGVKNLEAYLASNLPLPVRVVTAGKENELDDAMEAVTKARTATDAILIALVPLKDLKSITLVDADHALALVNTEALAREAKSPIRVNLAVLRALAGTLGVGNSYDPHCVYRRMAAAAEYDKLGGNFSPPTLQQVLIAAGERGVKTTLVTRKQPAKK